MSNTYQEWEDDDDDINQSQQSDSDLLKQLRKELKTKSKMLSEMEGQLSSIKTEIAENADVFGLTVQTPDDVKPDLATLRQIDSVTANAQSPAGLDDMYLRLQNAESAEEITNMIFQQGGEV
jgi:hypothetical protein